MSKTPQRKPLNPWPVAIVAFFAVAITGCVAFIAFCNRNSVDLVARDYYEQEVRYQKQIDREHRTRSEGSPLAIDYRASSQSITVSLAPSHLAGEVPGKIQLYRPSAAELDRVIPLQLDASGRQTISTAGLLPGLWKVRVTWSSGDKEYSAQESVNLTPL